MRWRGPREVGEMRPIAYPNRRRPSWVLPPISRVRPSSQRRRAAAHLFSPEHASSKLRHLLDRRGGPIRSGTRGVSRGCFPPPLLRSFNGIKCHFSGGRSLWPVIEPAGHKYQAPTPWPAGRAPPVCIDVFEPPQSTKAPTPCPAAELRMSAGA